MEPTQKITVEANIGVPVEEVWEYGHSIYAVTSFVLLYPF
jgi:hypothetical protein